MKYFWFVFPVVSFASQYTYSGNDPAQWSRKPVSSQYSAGAAADFTAYPCNSAQCSIGEMTSDNKGNTYVVGTRYFTLYGPNNTQTQTSDVFVAKLDPSGATVFLATFSGKRSDFGLALAVDPGGNVFVGGSTTSPNFPLRNAIQTQPSALSWYAFGGGTGFLIKLSAEGQLIYSTYFGGMEESSSVYGLATDADGNLYVTGSTGAKDFLITPGMPAGRVTGSSALSGIIGAFVAKLNPSGDKVLYSGIISGSAKGCSGGSSCFLSNRYTTGYAIAVDSASNCYVLGNTEVTNLPSTEGALLRDGIGAWIARVSASGTKLDYLTYLGAANYNQVGSFVDPGNVASDLAVDGEGNAYIVGRTSDPKFPATAGTLQPALSARPDEYRPNSDAFVAKLNPQGTAMVYATFLGEAGVDRAYSIAIDSGGSAYVTGEMQTSGFPITTGAPGWQDFIAVLNPSGSALDSMSRYPRGSVSNLLAPDPNGRVRSTSAGIVSSFPMTATAGTRLLSMANLASGQGGAVVSPGEVLSITGIQLGPESGAIGQPDHSGRMPTTLAGTTVLFDGIPAPLLYVSDKQIKTVAPFGLSPGGTTTVWVKTESAAAPELESLVLEARLGIFGNNGSYVLNGDGTANSYANPARFGSVVSAWVTGVGPLYPTPSDGQVQGATGYSCCSVRVNGEYAEPVYQGTAPGSVAGIFQLNFRVPGTLPDSLRQATVAVSTSSSRSMAPVTATATIYVAAP